MEMNKVKTRFCLPRIVLAWKERDEDGSTELKEYNELGYDMEERRRRMKPHLQSKTGQSRVNTVRWRENWKGKVVGGSLWGDVICSLAQIRLEKTNLRMIFYAEWLYIPLCLSCCTKDKKTKNI